MACDDCPYISKLSKCLLSATIKDSPSKITISYKECEETNYNQCFSYLSLQEKWRQYGADLTREALKLYLHRKLEKKREDEIKEDDIEIVLP